MARSWKLWGTVCAVFAVVAEAVNIFADEYHFLQWVLFIVSVVAFILAVTAWDQGRRRPKRD